MGTMVEVVSWLWNLLACSTPASSSTISSSETGAVSQQQVQRRTPLIVVERHRVFRSLPFVRLRYPGFKPNNSTASSDRSMTL
jgi:hypothetical protein